MSKPMTKTQLVAALAEKMGTDKKSAAASLDAICELITSEVSGGGAVTLPGVGKIYCRERPERMVRNPATGESFKKDADKVVKMTIAKALKALERRADLALRPNPFPRPSPPVPCPRPQIDQRPVRARRAVEGAHAAQHTRRSCSPYLRRSR